MINRNFNIPNFKFFKYFDQKNIGTLPRIFLCSVALILFFYFMPLLIYFVDQENNAFQNNSKAVLAYTLNNKGANIEDDAKIKVMASWSLETH